MIYTAKSRQKRWPFGSDHMPKRHCHEQHLTLSIFATIEHLWLGAGAGLTDWSSCQNGSIHLDLRFARCSHSDHPGSRHYHRHPRQGQLFRPNQSATLCWNSLCLTTHWSSPLASPKATTRHLFLFCCEEDLRLVFGSMPTTEQLCAYEWHHHSQPPYFCSIRRLSLPEHLVPYPSGREKGKTQVAGIGVDSRRMVADWKCSPCA